METIIISSTIFIILLVMMLYLGMDSLISLALVAMFFPIHIQMLGRDALTTATLFIFLLSFKYLVDGFRERAILKENLDYFVILIIFFGLLSVIIPAYDGRLDNSLVGPAFRSYIGYVSSLVIFIIIKYEQDKSLPFVRKESAQRYTKVINIIIGLTSVHILISIAVKYFPGMGSLFSVFLTREREVLVIADVSDDITRIKSFVFTPEIYGEIIATLSPLLMYKIYRTKKYIWYLVLVIFTIGLLMSVTRSGIILYLFGVIVFTFYNYRNEISKGILYAVFLISCLVIVFYISPSIYEDSISRFTNAGDTYQSTGSIIEAINRGRVFNEAFDAVISNISWFGNGKSEFNFHNLYLNKIHERGLVGALLFFTVMLYLVRGLIRAYKNNCFNNRDLVFACILSLFIFFINELKFEFNRHSSYQQICFGLFSAYYLIANKYLSLPASPSTISTDLER